MNQLKRFKFSLDVLLKVKDAEKKKLDHEIYNVNQELLCLRQKLEKIQDKKRDRDIMIQNALEKGVDVYRLKSYSIYREQLSDLRKLQLIDIEDADNKAEKLKREYIALKNELDMLDKLKKRQFDIYRYEMAQKQSKEIEDIISYKTSRGVQGW